MGKKLNAFFCRNFKASKFEGLANLAIERIAYLEKQHQVRCQQARSDVLQLLDLGQKDRALLRLEHLIREQNMLDAYSMIENYLNLLMERTVILQNNKKCPDELKEAIASLIFAASRCGELPELQKMRAVFTSTYGKELESHAIELRSNCGVSPKIVKKLSTRRPSLDSKMKTLKEVAPAHQLARQFEGESSGSLKRKLEAKRNQKNPEVEDKASSSTSANSMLEEVKNDLAAKLKLDEESVEQTNKKGKYVDAKTAAEAAFSFAALSAEAAKAAVELSRTKKADRDQNMKNQQQKGNKVFDSYESNDKDSFLSSIAEIEAANTTKEENDDSDPSSRSGNRKTGANPSHFGRRPLPVRRTRPSRLRSF